MLIAEFTLKLPVKIKRKAKVYISNCPVLDLYSQGMTEEEAILHLKLKRQEQLLKKYEFDRMKENALELIKEGNNNLKNYQKITNKEE